LRRVAESLPREMLLCDMNAALGLQQVKRIEQFIQKRREIASIYHRALLRGRHRLLLQPGEAENVFHSFAVVLASGAREVIQYARKKQVECIYAFEGSLYGSMVRPVGHNDAAESAESDNSGSPIDDANHEMELDAADFPGARSLTLRCVLFPLYPVLPKREVDRIEKVVTTLP